MTEIRKELAYEKHELPSRYWEGEPVDEDELVLPEDEWIPDDIELPFE